MKLAMRSRWLVPAAALLLLAAFTRAETVGGLGGPLFGLATAPNGALLVADASAGVLDLRGPRAGIRIPLPGVSDVSPLGRSSLWAVTGAGGGPTAAASETGQGVHRISQGRTRKLVSLFAFESLHNPDGGAIESNPFDVQRIDGKHALVADAAANALLRLSNRGRVDVVAVFPSEVVPTANLKQLAGCPSPAPFCGLPPAIPAQPVPTSIAIGGDGFIYVGELKGFPAPTGESNIWRIAPNASWARCGQSAECVKAFDGGFTSIIDLAFGPDGLLYVVELDAASWAAIEIFGAPTGGSVKACSLAMGTCSAVASAIPVPTAVAFGKDGSLWITRNALTPGGAEVVRLR